MHTVCSIDVHAILESFSCQVGIKAIEYSVKLYTFTCTFKLLHLHPNINLFFLLRIFVPPIPHTCLLMVWAVMMSHKANLVTAGLWLPVLHWLWNLLSWRRFVFVFWNTSHSQTCAQWSPLGLEGDCHVQGDFYLQVTLRKIMATENIGKLSGDRNIQDHCCSIYRAVIYRFDWVYPHIRQTHK